MTSEPDDDSWQQTEYPGTGPSAPPNLKFNPLATAIGVFVAVVVPILVVAYGQSGGLSATIVVIGIAAGIVFGVLAGVWVSGRDGNVWRGPQL